MSVDLEALATWSYESGVLTHIASGQFVELDIAASPRLHTLLSMPHWKHLGDKRNYSSDPADWIERDIDFSRRLEDPPVIGVEVNIGAGDHEYHPVIELEDNANYAPDLADIATILQDGHDNGFAPAHARELIKRVVHLFQIGDLL